MNETCKAAPGLGSGCEFFRGCKRAAFLRSIVNDERKFREGNASGSDFEGAFPQYRRDDCASEEYQATYAEALALSF